MGLELRKGDQVQFLIDRSGSMDTSDCDGDTRYHYAKEKVKAFVRGAAKYDPDGVSIHFFNNRVETHQNVATVEQIDALIDQHRPGGGTATDLAIQAAWKEHTVTKSAGTYVFIITDGEPSDPGAVQKQIVNITNSMGSPEEFRLAFLTVGVQSSELKAWLSALDSDLKGAKYDIVSVEELDKVDFEQAVADLVGSTTTAGEAAAGHTGGKTTTTI
jgi:uncharacterized protein YegL